MKIGILSQDIRLYSTKRLYDTAINRGHDTEVVSYLRCYMNIAKAKPRISVSYTHLTLPTSPHV